MQDCVALLALFNSTQGEFWGNHSNWSNGSCCDWYGVWCSHSHRVVRVELPTNNLVGSLPDSLASLDALETLLLSENSLTGPLPSWISSLTSLQVLKLNANYLNGTIPDSIGNLTKLDTLYLQLNLFSGMIPSSIGNLSSLQTVSLRSNALTGPIPPSIGNLSTLNFCYFWNNQLSGQIPKTMGLLSNLQELELEMNLLTGPFPSEMGQLTSLINLMAYQNAFTGGIPSLGTLTNLETLYLSSTEINGTIPDDMSLMTNLVVLVLAENNLVGKIPGSFSRLTRLQQLDLSFNSLSGEIPPGLTSLTDLGLVYLQDNQLEGPLPEWRLPLIQTMNLSSNMLTGPLGSNFATMTMLQTLDVHDNQLSGSLRDATNFLPSSVVFLDVSYNQFHGSDQDWNLFLPNLHAFLAGYNDLSGQHLSTAVVDSPAIIDLVETKLTCPLPHFGNTTTVSVSQPLPCILDTTLMFIEIYVLTGLAIVYLIFFCLSEKCPQAKTNLMWVRLLVRCFLRFLSLLAMGRFLYLAFYHITPFQASCHPVNHRPVFEPFLPMVFLCNHTEWPPPNSSFSFPQYMSVLCGPVPGCAGWDPADFRVIQTVGAFVNLCNSIAGCTAKVLAEGWPSCEEGLTPDAWFSNFDSVLAILWGFVGFTAGKELIKVGLLIYARCRGKFVLEHFACSSCWVPVLLGCDPLLKHVVMRTASPCDLLGEFVYGALLESLPLLALTVYFYLFVVQTSLDALSTASLPLSLLNSCFILAKAVAVCWRTRGAKQRISGHTFLTHRLNNTSLNADSGSPWEI